MKKFKFKTFCLFSILLIYSSCNNEENSVEKENMSLDDKIKTTLLSKIDDDQTSISAKLYSDPEKYGFKKSFYKNSITSKKIELPLHDYYVRQLVGEKEEYVYLLKNTNKSTVDPNNQYLMYSDHCICSGIAVFEQGWPVFDDSCEVVNGISGRGSINFNYVGDAHGEGRNQLMPDEYGTYWWASETATFSFQNRDYRTGSTLTQADFNQYLRVQPENWIIRDY